MLKKPISQSFFLFGPRGTGKTSWLRENFNSYSYIDLLDDEIYRNLLAKPDKLREFFKPNSEWIIIDEVQRIPAILNEVHRLIETQKLKFALSGSSARKFKKVGTNLLAGRAITKFMYPITAKELGKDFDLQRSLKFGLLPTLLGSLDETNAKNYLHSYVTTYLKEEVQQEGITRNLGAFSRFLEIASLSQASPLNVTAIAREIGIDNKTAENYFTILEDLLLAVRLPVFTKHAKRKMYSRSKFLYFDVGVYRAIRPTGPLDSPELIDGAALETLLFQELRSLNNYLDLGYDIYYWRTRQGKEIDFILYGEKGLKAFEVKRSSNPTSKDLKALKQFSEDYPIAKCYMFYGGNNRKYIGDNIELVPFEEGVVNLSEIIS